MLCESYERHVRTRPNRQGSQLNNALHENECGMVQIPVFNVFWCGPWYSIELYVYIYIYRCTQVTDAVYGISSARASSGKGRLTVWGFFRRAATSQEPVEGAEPCGLDRIQITKAPEELAEYLA